MKSFSAISCALSLIAVLNVANAKSMCTPMDSKTKAMYEEAYDTEFMGCTLSPGEGMTAMGRMNWMTPVGAPPMVEMDTSAGSEMEGMSKMKGGAMMMAAVKVAGSSLSRPGYLTVSSECIASLAPDFIYSVLAKSGSPKEFNAALEAACESGTVRTLKTTLRADEATIAIADAALCIIGSVLALFFPIFDEAFIAGLKTIVETVFDILPCPSVAARII